MRINESKIRQIIREEARRVLREGGGDEQNHKDRIASFETGYEFGHDDAEEELSGGALEQSGSISITMRAAAHRAERSR